MKTSIVLIALLLLNTSALLSEPLAQLVNGISPWLLIVLELVLLFLFYVHNQLKGLHKICEIDLSDIKLFVVKSERKTQGKP